MGVPQSALSSGFLYDRDLVVGWANDDLRPVLYSAEDAEGGNGRADFVPG